MLLFQLTLIALRIHHIHIVQLALQTGLELIDVCLPQTFLFLPFFFRQAKITFGFVCQFVDPLNVDLHAAALSILCNSAQQVAQGPEGILMGALITVSFDNAGADQSAAHILATGHNSIGI